MVAPEAGLVSERPEDHRRVVLVALKHSSRAVDVCLCPLGAVGELRPRGVLYPVPVPSVADAHSVRLDVRLVADVNSVSVAEKGKARVVRVVRGSYHVDVVSLHDHQVALHVVERGRVTEQRVAVVAVDALRLDLPAVYVDDLVDDLDPAEAYRNADDLTAAGEDEVIEVRLLVAPEKRGVDVRVNIPV